MSSKSEHTIPHNRTDPKSLPHYGSHIPRLLLQLPNRTSLRTLPFIHQSRGHFDTHFPYRRSKLLLQQQFWTRSLLEYSHDSDPIDLRALGAGRSLCGFPCPGLASGVGVVCSGLGVRGQCEEQRCTRGKLRIAKYDLWLELIMSAESVEENKCRGGLQHEPSPLRILWILYRNP